MSDSIKSMGKKLDAIHGDQGWLAQASEAIFHFTRSMGGRVSTAYKAAAIFAEAVEEYWTNEPPSHTPYKTRGRDSNGLQSARGKEG